MVWGHGLPGARLFRFAACPSSLPARGMHANPMLKAQEHRRFGTKTSMLSPPVHCANPPSCRPCPTPHCLGVLPAVQLRDKLGERHDYSKEMEYLEYLKRENAR